MFRIPVQKAQTSAAAVRAAAMALLIGAAHGAGAAPGPRQPAGQGGEIAVAAGKFHRTLVADTPVSATSPFRNVALLPVTLITTAEPTGAEMLISEALPRLEPATVNTFSDLLVPTKWMQPSSQIWVLPVAVNAPSADAAAW